MFVFKSDLWFLRFCLYYYKRYFIKFLVYIIVIFGFILVDLYYGLNLEYNIKKFLFDFGIVFI